MVGILAVARPCLATPAVAELYSIISSKLLGILLMGLMVQMLGWSVAVCCHAPKQVLAVSCAVLPPRRLSLHWHVVTALAT